MEFKVQHQLLANVPLHRVRVILPLGMDNMGSVVGRTPLQRMRFNNVALRKLPVDTSGEPESRTVRGACFSRVQPYPLVNPKFVALSNSALTLIGLSADEVLRDPHGAEYLSGSKLIPGSEPAAHCYCGHQFGQFAGQLGDGAVCYLGEVENPDDLQISQEFKSPCGRWEIQLKGAGRTPYSRQSDGRKVLRSSIREFLCSEAMFALGIPTTRVGSLVTSDVYVQRDIFYSGHPRAERCSVVLRIAPTFIRFGSFEIFHPVDDFTGRQGPSAGRHDIRAQLLDYVIESFYPEIQRSHTDRKERIVAFFREVTVRTARLVALWQTVGFCHGVLNTDNMSILGLTLDYGPFGFMDRFDPEFVCNASDKRGRYSYEAQPYVCRWNLARLADALGSELQAACAGPILDEFIPMYESFYVANMRRKLGLLRRVEPEDQDLISDLLKTMHNTGADFTNTFRLLSRVPCPMGKQSEEADAVGLVVERLLKQCASLEELKVANHPTVEPRELEMILSMAETNPGMFNMVANRPEVAKQLEKIGRLKELLDINQEDLSLKQKDDWLRWINRYRRRLALECEGSSDPHLVEKERVTTMDSTNPAVVLRNYIAQNAIEAAESGDFSEVQRVLKVLESPYSVNPGLERPGWLGCRNERGQTGHKEEESEGQRRTILNARCPPYTSKPPSWAREICVT
ncbi:protein adenylyltransferase SelO-1, mitochondrial-like [Chanos chanos]|uniref:Selenoprotein O n=1 Tax=Chanos chanos TaxID=29144 RepID=A0A6J2WY92_CHACN|nr:protein adenylyltransferase SelO-1, mitochondrial-like [Chanos chanos]